MEGRGGGGNPDMLTGQNGGGGVGWGRRVNLVLTVKEKDLVKRKKDDERLK